MKPLALGLDFGTNSVRALVVDCTSGRELATHVFEYPHGEAGILLDRKNVNLARQHPQDYLDGTIACVRACLRRLPAEQIVGIGVDTTGSTPIPVDEKGQPLAFHRAFRKNLAAMAWLWKDHTGFAEAEAITTTAAANRPQYLTKCGGKYSSEWFWSKIWHCVREAPAVFDAAYTWVEHADWMPAVLTGTDHPDRLKRGICAAGHKAMFHDAWGGYPDEEFLRTLEPKLARIRQTLPARAYTIADRAGELTEAWAKKLGLRPGIPVAVGAFDAHLGAVGSGIRPGTLVKIIGTSTCDMMVAPLDTALPDIPGLCGIVPQSILPGYYGLEAGQSAVGDIFNWFVRFCGQSHETLTRAAARLRPGESGLLALDWHNGNRTILVDQRLTGLIVGLTLHSTPAEVYRAWVEATAFGARRIMERFEEYGIRVERVVNCGGISVKNTLVMQIYADVLNRPLEISRSTQTCALGAAMAGAVVGGAHRNFAEAAEVMTGTLRKRFLPDPARVKVYDRIYQQYRRLHDVFGTTQAVENLHDLMKELLAVRDATRH
ncbi:MAG: ribulokinase [Verrucomicrobiae bacterium]|nr:ribulokinase [Verrucomicrobiae bacterium]